MRGIYRSYCINCCHCQVQPRVCGEYWNFYQCRTDLKGSTPRMRGIFDVDVVIPNSGRFNPAYAGNIIWMSGISRRLQVQPRVCGEYVHPSRPLVTCLGSTPRMRGISHYGISTDALNRFNPAYAGNISQIYDQVSLY